MTCKKYTESKKRQVLKLTKNLNISTYKYGHIRLMQMESR